MTDEALMTRAIALAREAIAAGQMPVAAVLARDGAIVAEAHNTVWRDTDPTAHAEMNAVRRAASLLKTVDLSGTTIYATLEPCPMCLGAIHWAKIDRAVFGASIADSAAVGFNELAVPATELARMGGSRVVVEGGLLREECVALLEEWKRAGKGRAY
ncbi:MAG TPA: nucleoside deaminase [Isosphaeraceae bacterium]|jgi:tRNA(Arg) A34 adenosine deaminase TadA